MDGAADNDQLYGNAGDDTLAGGAGNDLLIGEAGEDLVDGGDGNDELQGGDDADTLAGGLGNDTLIGQGGSDTLNGGDGNDLFYGGQGDDAMDGGLGNDTVNYIEASGHGLNVDLQAGTASGGGVDSDTLTDIENVTGSGFNDMLAGDTGINVLSGAGGDDTLFATAGGDTLDGGADGASGDTASFANAAGGVTVTLVGGAQDVGGGIGFITLTNIEHLTGSGADDVMTGDSFNNVLSGGNGNDTLSGGDGNDGLDGGDGNDTADYSAAGAGVVVDLNTNTAQDTGGAGSDTLTDIENLTGSGFDDTLTGDGNANILIGGGGNDSLYGGEGGDTLNGGDGEGSLFGGDGNDILRGGLGNDTLEGFAGSDTADYSDGTMDGLDVNLGTSLSSGGGLGDDELFNIDNLIGSAFADTLTGDSNANILRGGLGNDTLDGGGGTDVAYYAGRESQYAIALNSVSGGADGNDTLTGIERVKFLSPSDVSDLDNNGAGDLIYQNQTNGNISVRSYNNGAVITPQPANLTGVGGAAWQVVATGKFTADSNRNDSILVQNSSSKDLRVITISTGAAMLGVNMFAFGTQPGAGWVAVDTGDFNGDATSDVLLQNGGNAMILYMGGTAGSVTSQASFAAPTGFTAISAGDFNGDGKSDILWQDTSSKDVQVGLTDGTSASFSPGAGFTAIGTGDFNNDGYSDILFSNGAGAATIWLMNGTSHIDTRSISGPTAAGTWTAVGAQDVVGPSGTHADGFSDIIWTDPVAGNSRATVMTTGAMVANGNLNLSSPGTAFQLMASTGGG
jgi:Ca2+-binding RTX toxin-like protein